MTAQHPATSAKSSPNAPLEKEEPPERPERVIVAATAWGGRARGAGLQVLPILIPETAETLKP